MVVVAIATAINVWGQEYPDGYLADETYPSYDFIPSPPSVTSGEFANIIGTEACQQQLQKAREEYQNLKNGTVSVFQAKSWSILLLAVRLTTQPPPKAVMASSSSARPQDACKARTDVKPCANEAKKDAHR